MAMNNSGGDLGDVAETLELNPAEEERKELAELAGSADDAKTAKKRAEKAMGQMEGMETDLHSMKNDRIPEAVEAWNSFVEEMQEAGIMDSDMEKAIERGERVKNEYKRFSNTLVLHSLMAKNSAEALVRNVDFAELARDEHLVMTHTRTFVNDAKDTIKETLNANQETVESLLEELRDVMGDFKEEKEKRIRAEEERDDLRERMEEMEDAMDDSFDKRDLAEGMVENGLSHKEAAGVLGVDRSTVSKWVSDSET